MRTLILAAATALAFSATASPAKAQIVIYNSNAPAVPGIHVVTTPPFYGGLAFNNGTITAFQTPPPFGYYPAFGFPGVNPYSGYPVYPNRYPLAPNTYPNYWRP